MSSDTLNTVNIVGDGFPAPFRRVISQVPDWAIQSLRKNVKFIIYFIKRSMI